MQRWPELKLRRPRSLELHGAKATSKRVVASYFTELETVLKKYNLADHPEHIYNVDEKGLKHNRTPLHIVVSASSKAPPAVMSGKGSTITVICCISWEEDEPRINESQYTWSSLGASVSNSG